MEQSKRYHSRYGKFSGKNRYKQWSSVDKDLIMNSLLTDVEIHKKIGRSVKAIQVKRAEIKLELKGR